MLVVIFFFHAAARELYLLMLLFFFAMIEEKISIRVLLLITKGAVIIGRTCGVKLTCYFVRQITNLQNNVRKLIKM